MMNMATNSNENHSSPDERIIDVCAIPLDVQIQIAESKRRMAESRYRSAVARGSSWADKARKLDNPAKENE